MEIKISYKTISRFAQQYGSVSIVDAAGKTRLLINGDPDTFDLIKNANCFDFDGKRYTREEFKILLASKTKNPNDS